jgi:predicted lipoprotein
LKPTLLVRFPLALACVLAALAFGCHRTPQKNQILAAVAREVALPIHRGLDAESRNLHAAVTAFADAPSVPTLTAARVTWRKTAVAWRRAYAFREGPLVETSALLRAAYWPSNPKHHQAMLADTAPITADRIQEAGVEAKGLYVIEALLFEGGEPAAAVPALWQGESGARRVQLLRVLAADVQSYGAAIAGRLETGGDAFVNKYAEAGQGSLNRLVNQLIESIEGVAVNRLQLVIGLADSHLLKSSEVEGWPSGSSHLLALAPIEVSQQLYLGGPSGGISALVRNASPEQDERVRAAFALAVAKIEALGGPLEQVVTSKRPALEEAAAVTRNLEITIKTELANALGIALTFVGGDGD